MDLRNGLIPEKVNEGRLISALSLEQRVLANGVLPNSPPMERISLVKGMITGLLEKGEWNEAIRLVYEDGSPARVLFDGDWEGLRKDILASVQQQREWYIGESVASLLLKHNETELLYDIACKMPLGRGDLREILEMVESKIPAERMKEGYNIIAAQAEKENERASAYEYYRRAGNEEAITSMYQRLLKGALTITTSDPDLRLLLDIALETSTDKNNRGAETVYAVLQRPGLLRQSPEMPLRLAQLVNGHKVALSKSQDKLLKDALVSLPLYSIKDLIKTAGGEDLSLRWAKAHAESDPKDAYHIFKRVGYTGPKLATAVQQGLKNHGENRQHYCGLAPDEIEESHLRQVYDSLPLELKMSVADHLKDNALLRDLSRRYSRKDAGTAYRLWISGQGEHDNPYMIKLRTSMMQKELTGKFGPSAHLFLPEDTIGNRMWFAQLIEKHPEEAYDVAQRIQHEHLVDQARLKMIATSPLEALRKFEGYDKKDRDIIGINLALDALAQQYDVPRQKVNEYLALQK